MKRSLSTQPHTEDQYPISAKTLYIPSIFLHEFRILSSTRGIICNSIQWGYKYTTAPKCLVDCNVMVFGNVNRSSCEIGNFRH